MTLVYDKPKLESDYKNFSTDEMELEIKAIVRTMKGLESELAVLEEKKEELLNL